MGVLMGASGWGAQEGRSGGHRLQLDRPAEPRLEEGGERIEIVADRPGIARQAAVGALETGKPAAPLLAHHATLDPAGGGDSPEGGFVGEEAGEHAPCV